MDSIYVTKAEALANNQVIIANAKLGIKGNATQTNAPTSYNPTDFPNGLYESYKVIEPITMGSAWGIEVTQTELDENFVYFDVKNGVVSKFMSLKISGKDQYQSYLDTTTDSPPMTEAEYAVYKGEILDNSVIPEKTTFAKSIKVFSTPNRFNKATKTSGHYINEIYGSESSNPSYNATDFIQVNDLQGNYISATLLNHGAFYDKDKIFLEGFSIVESKILVPLNAFFLRTSIYAGDEDVFQVVAGKNLVAYESYEEPADGVIIEKLVLEENVVENYMPTITTPATMYWLEGEQLNVYFDNIIFGKLFQKRDDFYTSAFSYRGRFLEKKYRVTPTDDFFFKIKAENESGFIEKYTNVKTSLLTNGSGITRKILGLGDSTIANGYMLYVIKQFFASDVMDVNFVGTKTDNTVLNEGRSGWAYSTFNSNYAGNPFWNTGTSAFDFSYYLTSTSQTMGANDWVFIQLGINDLFAASYLEPTLDIDARIISMQNHLTNMIASIHAYNSGIRIGISITIPPAISQDASGNYSDGSGNPFNSAKYSLEYYVKKGLVKWWEYLLETYDNTTSATNKIYLIPTNVCIDRTNNFPKKTEQLDSVNTTMVNVQNNDVHPETTGYQQMAKAFIGVIKYFE